MTDRIRVMRFSVCCQHGGKPLVPLGAQQVVVALAVFWIAWCCTGAALYAQLRGNSLCCEQQHPVKAEVNKVIKSQKVSPAETSVSSVSLAPRC
jgi:hypothetical protein